MSVRSSSLRDSRKDGVLVLWVGSVSFGVELASSTREVANDVRGRNADKVHVLLGKGYRKL